MIKIIQKQFLLIVNIVTLYYYEGKNIKNEVKIYEKILIYGGTGFIGTQLIKKLKAEGKYLILATRKKNNENEKVNIIDEIVEYRIYKKNSRIGGF